MLKVIYFFIFSGCMFIKCTSAQQVEVEEVDFAEKERYWISNIRGNKSIDIKTQFTYVARGKRFLSTRTNGLIYCFDMDKEKIIEGGFVLFNDGYTDRVNYYEDKKVIAWAKRQSKLTMQDSIYVLKIYDYEKNAGKEKYFVLPKGKLLQSHPVIIDTNKILIDNMVFYEDKRTPDTLDIKERKIEARTEGRTFMRRNMYITDNCFEARERWKVLKK